MVLQTCNRIKFYILDLLNPIKKSQTVNVRFAICQKNNYAKKFTKNQYQKINL